MIEDLQTLNFLLPVENVTFSYSKLNVFQIIRFLDYSRQIVAIIKTENQIFHSKVCAQTTRPCASIVYNNNNNNKCSVSRANSMIRRS